MRGTTRPMQSILLHGIEDPAEDLFCVDMAKEEAPPSWRDLFDLEREIKNPRIRAEFPKCLRNAGS